MYKNTSIEALLKSKDGIRALVEIMANDENCGMSLSIFKAVLGIVARRPQIMDFLKKALQEIVDARGSEAALVTVGDLLKVLSSSVQVDKGDSSTGRPYKLP